MVQMMRMTRSTLMPEEAASAGLSATARAALPVRVRSSAMPTTTRTTSSMPIAMRFFGAAEMGPICDARLGVVLRRTTRSAPPNRIRNRYRRNSATPIEMIIMAMMPVPRLRSCPQKNLSWL